MCRFQTGCRRTESSENGGDSRGRYGFDCFRLGGVKLEELLNPTHLQGSTHSVCDFDQGQTAAIFLTVHVRPD